MVLLLVASVCLAKSGAVRTKDGRTIEGDVTDNGDTVVVALKAASITMPRSDIDSITYAASIEEQYQQRRAALPGGAGAKSHVDLARWLYDNKAYALARQEASTALELDPNSADAFVLRQTIDRAIEWEKKPATQPAETAGTQKHLLNMDQINAIRQHEVKENERLAVRFDNNVVRRYIESEKGNLRNFNSSPDMVKAWAIMKNAELRKDVHIMGTPAAIMEFRRVQPFILAGCATASCHGGTAGGTFALTAPADSEAITYTNLYILSKYATNREGVTQKMIDRQQPANSLLVEYAKPREATKHPHPEVVNFAPIFRNPRDPREATLLKWIGMLAVPEPDYGIDFPVPGAATRPAGVTEKAGTAAASTAKPAPAAKPANPPAKAQPADQKNDDNGRNDANESLKDLRSRLHPIRPF
jgi:hypothetical protein